MAAILALVTKEPILNRIFTVQGRLSFDKSTSLAAMVDFAEELRILPEFIDVGIREFRLDGKLQKYVLFYRAQLAAIGTSELLAIRVWEDNIKRKLRIRFNEGFLG